MHFHASNNCVYTRGFASIERSHKITPLTDFAIVAKVSNVDLPLIYWITIVQSIYISTMSDVENRYLRV